MQNLIQEHFGPVIFCGRRGMPDATKLYGGTMLEGSVGTLASAHAFLTLKQLTWGTELFGPLLLTEDIVTETPQYRDFELHIPRTPGLGLTLDEERLARFQRRP